MTIYTRAGDKGKSSTMDGQTLEKSNPIFEANGTLDELSACLGLARASLAVHSMSAQADHIKGIQRDILLIGTCISSGDPQWLDRLEYSPESFERSIDELMKGQNLTGFIIAGENQLEASFHLARTVCRRSERRIAALDATRRDPRLLAYVNRLSDLLFAYAAASRSIT